MPIPDYQTLMLPLLKYASSGGDKSIKDATIFLSDEFKLTPEDRQLLLPSGRQRTITNRIGWATTHLDKAGLIERTNRGHFKITERGKEVLASNPDKITNKLLSQYPEFVTFITPKKTDDFSQLDGSENTSTTTTPEEAIYEAEAELSAKLSNELLSRIGDMSPAFFEQLVVDLIVAMGYGGGSRDIVAQRIGKSGDEGIDGIINEDALGLDVVYIQAKRYKPDSSIGREKLQQFSGALVGQNAHKGVFVTTSSFTKGAREYVQHIPQRIILIDGAELASLMIRYGVGVRCERSVEIKRLDTDYFENDDE